MIASPTPSSGRTFPSELLGDLRSLAEEVKQPLAVRSSSLLEDALARPFAGIYETKMTPNNQAEAGARFHLLAEAIKFVYASTFFRDARTYRRAAGIDDGEEKMAVMIQEMVGARHGDRFYPDLSAVCRSYSYYPVGRAAREDGVAVLALGLGKTIVDGGLCWSYSPRRPKAPRPFASTRQMLTETQSRFWAVSMARPSRRTIPPWRRSTWWSAIWRSLSSTERSGTWRPRTTRSATGYGRGRDGKARGSSISRRSSSSGNGR